MIYCISKMGLKRLANADKIDKKYICLCKNGVIATKSDDAEFFYKLFDALQWLKIDLKY